MNLNLEKIREKAIFFGAAPKTKDTKDTFRDGFNLAVEKLWPLVRASHGPCGFCAGHPRKKCIKCIQIEIALRDII